MALLPRLRNFTMPPPQVPEDPMIDPSGALAAAGIPDVQPNYNRPPLMQAPPISSPEAPDPIEQPELVRSGGEQQDRYSGLLDQLADIQKQAGSKPSLLRQIAAIGLGMTRRGQGLVPMVSGDAARERALQQVPVIQAQIRAQQESEQLDRQAQEAEGRERLRQEQIRSEQGRQAYNTARTEATARPKPPAPMQRDPEKEVGMYDAAANKYSVVDPAKPKTSATPPRETPQQAQERRLKEVVDGGEDPNTPDNRIYIRTGRMPNPQRPQGDGQPKQAGPAQFRAVESKKQASLRQVEKQFRDGELTPDQLQAEKQRIQDAYEAEIESLGGSASPVQYSPVASKPTPQQGKPKPKAAPEVDQITKEAAGELGGAPQAAGNRIRVQLANGQTGTIDEKDFDPTTMKRL